MCLGETVGERNSTRASRERLLLTLLFLNAVGLQRISDLRNSQLQVWSR